MQQFTSLIQVKAISAVYSFTFKMRGKARQGKARQGKARQGKHVLRSIYKDRLLVLQARGLGRS
jgi:hypothetical protein